MSIIRDNFVRDPEAVRAHALGSTFIDWPAPDGEVYKRICLTEVPGLRDAIEAEFGPVDMLGMAYRLNFNGERPNAAIHSDIGWGTHACVLFLSEGPGGTAFWMHKNTRAGRLQQGDEGLWRRIDGDWNNKDAWEMIGLAPMKLGRAVIYESERFHSRWPFEAFGTGPEDGRLVAVSFFTPKEPRR